MHFLKSKKIKVAKREEPTYKRKKILINSINIWLVFENV